MMAIHISDGFLTWPWLLGGLVGAVALGAGAVLTDLVLNKIKGREFRDEEIAHLALMTAAFYVASLIHVRLGPTSVHLLFNGLLGVVLRWRAALAIPVGLFLQYYFFQHGGFNTLGINSCVLTLPALLAWLLFAGLHRLPCVRQPWCRGLLVALSALAWTLSLVYSVSLFCTNRFSNLLILDPEWANFVTFHPLTLLTAVTLAGLAAWLEPRLENAPEFPLGLLVGEVAVLATMCLNCLVLIHGGEEDWGTVALLTFVAHLPIAVIEGVVLGFTVGYLARVKPEMLGWHRAIRSVSLPTPSVNGVTAPAERPRPAAPPTGPGRD